MKKIKRLFTDILLFIEAVILIVISAVFIIARIWIGEKVDSYVYPEIETVCDTALTLHERFTLPEISLSENETLYYTVSNSDIISLDNSTVTALAVFPDCYVRGYVVEKQRAVEADPYSDIVICGYDISAYLNRIYYTVRDYLDIELIKSSQSPRVLRIYQYSFTVSEPDYSLLPVDKSLSLSEKEKSRLDIITDEKHFITDFIISNDKSVKLLLEDGSYSVEALSADKSRIYFPLKIKTLITQSEYDRYSSQ